MEEIEYIPFYGELKMTTFTSEDRKEAAKKKPKKEKVTLVQSAPEVAEEPTTVSEVTQDLSLEESIEKAKEWFKPESEFTPTDWAALNDPPEPGITDVASTPKGANIVRRGFTTIQMARAFLSRLQNPEDYVIVEVREGNGLMLDGPILAHYVIDKSQEL
jgi:hypothetical protein